VVVVSVVLMNFHQVRFVFSEPVTCDGAGNEQIIIQTEVGPDVPVESEQVDATTILFWFDSGFVVAGNFWNLIAAPDGLDFQGRTCAAPQGGVVE
jgi:hypothetical protein